MRTAAPSSNPRGVIPVEGYWVRGGYVMARLRLLAVLMVVWGALPRAQSFEVATVKPTPAEQRGIDQPSIVQFSSQRIQTD